MRRVLKRKILPGKLSEEQKCKVAVTARETSNQIGGAEMQWADPMTNDLVTYLEGSTFHSFNADAYFRKHYPRNVTAAGDQIELSQKVKIELIVTVVICAVIREHHPDLVKRIDAAITTDLLKEIFKPVPEFKNILTENIFGPFDNRKRKRKDGEDHDQEWESLTKFAKELVFPLLLFTENPNKYMSLNTAKHFSNYTLQLESGVPSLKTMRYQYLYHALTGIQPAIRNRERKDSTRLNHSVAGFKENLRTHIAELYRKMRPHLLPIYDYVRDGEIVMEEELPVTVQKIKIEEEVTTVPTHVNEPKLASSFSSMFVGKIGISKKINRPREQVKQEELNVENSEEVRDIALALLNMRGGSSWTSTNEVKSSSSMSAQENDSFASDSSLLLSHTDRILY